MEATISKGEDAAPRGFDQDSAGPVRVVVTTLTHLVPGPKNLRHSFLLDGVCKHHFGCILDSTQYRLCSSGELDRDGERYHLLVDYGESLNDDDARVVSYQWTGDSFKPAPHILKSRRAKFFLNDLFKFTRPPFDAEEAIQRSSTIRSAVRKKIMYRLEDRISEEEFKHMIENPEDMEWVKKTIRPAAKYEKLVALVNMRIPPGQQHYE